MFLRYAILILVAIPNLYLFYLIFAPLTIYPTYFLLNLFFEATLNQNVIQFNSSTIELVPACIAGAAYYLLLILNLSTPDIKFKKRIKLIFLSFLIFLVLNLLRIFFLSLLFTFDSSYFDITHKIFWYAVSTLFVVGIWFFQVRYYKIRKIPVYSDLKYISGKSILGK
jgi:exosortase/archaeosortase family protein